MQIINLEEKIRIFERFAKTGEKITLKTVFEGYPIGQWAIATRYLIKRAEKAGKKSRITENQLKRLEELGILEKRIDSTVDEKIDSLIEWRKKYPKLDMEKKSQKKVTTILKNEYSNSDEEYEKIKEEYNKMKKYYNYIRIRKSQGLLSEEQILKCQDGNIHGVFGYSSQITELTEKYKVSRDDAEYLLTKYETLDNFYEKYKSNTIIDDRDKKIARIIIKNVIDMDCGFNDGYDEIYDKITSTVNENNSSRELKYELKIYSSEKLKDAINSLNEKEKKVYTLKYGLVDGTTPQSLSSIGKSMGVTKERVRQIEIRSLKKLRKNCNSIGINVDFESMETSNTNIKKINELIKNIQLKKGNLKQEIEELKIIIEKRNEYLRRNQRTEKQDNDNRTLKNEIKYLNLSNRTYNSLTRGRIKDLSELTQKTSIKTEEQIKEDLEKRIIEQQKIIEQQEQIIKELENQIKGDRNG